MAFYKNEVNGYINSIYKASGAGNITEKEYQNILDVIHNKPPRTPAEDYRLKADLTWEAYELQPIPEPQDDDLNSDELLDILLGGDGV